MAIVECTTAAGETVGDTEPVCMVNMVRYRLARTPRICWVGVRPSVRHCVQDHRARIVQSVATPRLRIRDHQLQLPLAFFFTNLPPSA